MDIYSIIAIEQFLDYKKVIKGNRCVVMRLLVKQENNGDLVCHNTFSVTFNRSNSSYYEVTIDSLSPYSCFNTDYQTFKFDDDGKLVIDDEDYTIIII